MGTAVAFGPAMFPIQRCKFIHLIRHGQGYHNVAGANDYAAYMSPEFEDASLTPMGWQQTAALKAHLAAMPGGFRVELVVTSPLMRTMQTAVGVFGGGIMVEGDPGPPLMVKGAGKSAVGTISAVGSPPVVAVEMCREHLGKHPCDRRSSVTRYQELFPAIDLSLVESDEDVWWKADERESTEDLNERGRKFGKWLMTRPETHIAVVSHSSFLIHFLSQFGDDCGEEVRAEVRSGYNNCEMRSLVLVDRDGGTMPTEPISTFANFKGGHIGSTSSDEADEALKKLEAQVNGKA